jgi:hypothetical protein
MPAKKKRGRELAAKWLLIQGNHSECFFCRWMRDEPIAGKVVQNVDQHPSIVL